MGLVVVVRCNTLTGHISPGFWNRGAVIEQHEQLLVYTFLRGFRGSGGFPSGCQLRPACPLLAMGDGVRQTGKDGTGLSREGREEKRERFAPEGGLESWESGASGSLTCSREKREADGR
jgi:hypothetical protein